MPESIGQLLKHERETRRLTIEKAAEATRLRPQYLQALENDDYSVMSSAAQGRGFLRLYADFLELNLDEVLSGMKTSADARTQSATPVPVVAATPEPEPPAQSAPASTPDAKPARSGFWARLLRKSVPAAPAEDESKPKANVESTPAPASVVVAEPVPAPAPVEEVVLEPVKPARKASTARKTKPSEPSQEKTKTVRRSTKPATSKKKE
jgi:cytoskeletal protein RodZ